MAQLTDLERVRKRRARRRLVRNLLALGVLGAVISLAMVVIREIEQLNLSVVYQDIKAEMVGSVSEFPMPLPGGKLQALSAADETLMLLSDTNLYSYNNAGKQLMNVQHGLSNQVMLPARDRTLLYDGAGNKLALYSRSAQVFSLNTSHNIYTADIAQNGNFAVATGSNEHLAKVNVYSKSGHQNIYNCYFADRLVSSLSLADHRDAMVVGCLEVKDGSYLSSVSRYQLSIEKEMGRADLPGELLLKVDYFSSDSIRVVTDKRVVILNGELKEKAAYTYPERIQRFLLRPDGGAVLVLGNYAEQKQLTVVLLDAGLREQGQIQIAYELVDLKADSTYVYLASQDELTILRSNAEICSILAVPNLHNIQPMGGYLYYATNTTLSREQISELADPKKQPNNTDSSSKDASKANSAASASADTSAESASADSSAASSGSQSQDVEQSAAQSSTSNSAASESTPSFDSLHYDAIKPKDEE